MSPPSTAPERRNSQHSDKTTAPDYARLDEKPDRPSQDSKTQNSVANADGGEDEEARSSDGAEHDHLDALETANSADAVPNGGSRAWLQVLGSFFIFFNTYGIVNAFGIYQTYYETSALFHASPSDISWIGSLQTFLLMFVSSLAGPIYDAGYVRQIIATGSFLVVFGQMMLSISSAYWQVLLAQGVCVGLGAGLLFVTGVAILSTYFSTRLATVTGIAATGSSLGAMLYPIIFYKLQPRIGFGWATRVLAFIALGTLVVANVASKARVLPTSRRKVLDLAAWKEAPYTLFTVAMFLGFIGLYTPFFYVQSFVLSRHIMGPELSFYLLAILNAASTFGRLLPNLLADRIGPMNTIIPCTFLTGILCFCLIAADTSASVIVVIALYGFCSGTYVSLPPTVYVRLSSSKRSMIGTRMGMAFASMSFGVVIGTPIAGAILTASSFTFVWVFGGLFTTLSAAIILMARIAEGGWRVRVKV